MQETIDAFLLHHTSIIRYAKNNINSSRGQRLLNPLMACYGLEDMQSSISALYRNGYIDDEEWEKWILAEDINVDFKIRTTIREDKIIEINNALAKSISKYLIE